MRSEKEDDIHAMDSVCMNLENDIDINCHCNEPSESVTNQLFNTDASGGSCYVFQSSYTELPPSTSSCLSAIPDYDASGREADQDQHTESSLLQKLLLNVSFTPLISLIKWVDHSITLKSSY